MSVENSSSEFTFSVEIIQNTPTSNFSFGRVSGGGALAPSQTLSYRDAIDDLTELAAEAQCEGNILPSQDAVEFASYVLNRVSSAYPPPEVTSRENGTVLLLWHDDRGFLSIEIGEHKFGLISNRAGFPSVRIDGDNMELSRQLPRRAAASLFGRSEQLAVSTANREGILSRLVSSANFVMSSARAIAAFA